MHLLYVRSFSIHPHILPVLNAKCMWSFIFVFEVLHFLVLHFLLPRFQCSNDITFNDDVKQNRKWNCTKFILSAVTVCVQLCRLICLWNWNTNALAFQCKVVMYVHMYICWRVWRQVLFMWSWNMHLMVICASFFTDAEQFVMAGLMMNSYRAHLCQQLPTKIFSRLHSKLHVALNTCQHRW